MNNADNDQKLLEKQILESSVAQQVEIMISSSYPILYLTTSEERRAFEMLYLVASKRLNLPLMQWSSSEGLRNADGSNARALNEKQVLNELIAHREPGIFVLQDFHPYLLSGDPLIIRRLRDIVAEFRRSQRTLVFVSPIFTLPPELEKDITLIDFELPSYEELWRVLNSMVKQAEMTGCQVNLDDFGADQIVKAMQGLTESQAQNVLARCLVRDGMLGVEHVSAILKEKEQIIKKSGMLEFFSSPENFKQIGGMSELKTWFSQRKYAFSETAHHFGLPHPKGILLIGVPGCGKSLCAKALAAEWDKPLLRLDVGRIFGGLVGQSEENMRHAIKVAESVAPAILWIDEIEKGFSGMQSGGDGGGVVARVFGTMLNWMQDKTAPVFIIATANDISQLPPELMRKGRFDEMFFVDLPFEEERAEIFRIHISRRNRDVRNIDIDMLVKQTNDYSGAEIEQIVIDALYEAFNNKQRQDLEKGAVVGDTDLTTNLLLETAKKMKPLSQTMEAQIDGLRNWAHDRCRLASLSEREASGTRIYEMTNGGFELRNVRGGGRGPG